jgi:glycosyltransferase involved in cell wall biosynthesis
LRTEIGIPVNAQVVVSTARFAKEKAVDRAIRAFDTLASEIDNLWLLLVGTGPLENELISITNSSHARQRIRFLGHLDDVLPVLQASDVYVLPSRTEALGIALLEAMSCKLLCVATRTSGPSEIIEHDSNGFLVEQTDWGICEGLRKALNLSRIERDLIASRARQTVSEKFPVESAVESTLCLLNVVATERVNQAPAPSSPENVAPHPLGHTDMYSSEREVRI